MWLCHLVFGVVFLFAASAESRLQYLSGVTQVRHRASSGVCFSNCENGGIAEKSVLGFSTCRCSPFYEGSCCEKPKCTLNGFLSETKDNCICPPKQSGKFCENVDCGPGSLALRSGDFFCDCPPGYNGTYCENKIPENSTIISANGMVVTGYCYCFAHNAPQMFVMFTMFLTILGISAFLTCSIIATRKRVVTRVSPGGCELAGVYVCSERLSPLTAAKRALKDSKDDIERRYFAIGYDNDRNADNIPSTIEERREKTPTPPPSYDDATGMKRDFEDSDGN